jgi:hypothetical protein
MRMAPAGVGFGPESAILHLVRQAPPAAAKPALAAKNPGGWRA